MRMPVLPWWMFEFLAAPGHLWIWISARLCGGTFTYSHIVEEDDSEYEE